MKSNLRQTINKLRLTKYPRTLVKQLYLKGLVKEDDFPVNTIFAIKRRFNSNTQKAPNAPNKWRFLREDLYLVFETDVHEKNLYESILEISSRPPLSKFGIEPKFYLMSRDAFIQQETHSPSFNHKRLWLYQKGIMNVCHMRLGFNEWKELSGEGSWKVYFRQVIPPVMSNVKVNQPVVKSWRPKKQIL